MSLVIPHQYLADVQAAAKATGLPADVVGAQVYTESNFNPDAVSPTGAQGIVQFEPDTWETYGSGSPFNVSDAFAAYAKYMKSLLKDEHGNVRNALAAYNAGPGNLAAGYGYADHILGLAKASPDLLADVGKDVKSAVGGLLSLPSSVTGFLSDLEKPVQGAMWLVDPGHWVRILAGIAGFFFLGFGLLAMAKAA